MTKVFRIPSCYHAFVKMLLSQIREELTLALKLPENCTNRYKCYFQLKRLACACKLKIPEMKPIDQKDVTQRKLLCSKLTAERSGELIEVRFEDGSAVIMNGIHQKALELMFYCLEKANTKNKLVEGHPEVEEQHKIYMKLVKTYKKTEPERIRAYFADKTNWELLRVLVPLHATVHFNLVDYYYRYFPYSDESDDAFAFFKDIYIYHQIEDYGPMGELFQLSYPYPRYFWYLLRDHWENKDKERRLYFFLKYGRHQFPYNRENLNYLLRLIGSLQPAYYCSAYEKILRCMGRNVPDDCTHEHYVTMVDDVCRCANLPVSPRLYEIMNIAKHASPMELNLQPYYDYATVFYGAGYYQQTKEDVLDVLRCWRGKSLKPKRLMFMAFMLRSLEKRQPGSIKALETHDDAKLSEWVREADKDPAYFFLCN